MRTRTRSSSWREHRESSSRGSIARCNDTCARTPPTGEGPCLTGGGILEARWDHRESRDIDIVIRARTRGDVREALDTAASEAGGYRVEGPEIDRIEFFDHTKDEHVDVSFVKPNPQGGAKQATVRHRCTSREELQEVLDERGFNAFLEAHDRDPVLIAEVACTAMETGNPETAIRY